MNKREVRSTPHTIQKRNQSQGVINDLHNVDFIPSNVNSSHQEALLYISEDNEAIIKMIIKGRTPTMRHVSRTRRVALDWVFDRINLDPKIQIKYIDTKNQVADMLTKGNFTRDEWNHLLCLFNICHFSSTVCSEAMAKRVQQDSGEERVTAKSRPMMSLIARAPSTLSSSASESPGKKGSAEKTKFIFDECYRKRRKTFYDMGMFMSVTLESAVFMGKNYLDNCQSIATQQLSHSNKCLTYLQD